jgi:serpin B
VADGLWVRRNLTLVPAFAQRNQQFYGARVAAVDFSNPATRTAINAWVSQQTHGKIASIIDHPIDPTTALYLVNALYFKGRWAMPFDKAATRDGAFTGPEGRRTVPMMSRSGSFAYYRGRGFQAVGLPYGSGRLRMYVFLPDAGSDLNAFRRGLSAQAWRGWLGRFASVQGKLALPRFTLEFGAALNGALAALGMDVAFDPNRADFTGMVTNHNVFISEVRHKTYMQVDEEGTTAAGSTAVGMQPTLALLPQFTMIVNRPFFCAIHDQLTGMPLFMGSIVAPA